MTKKQVAPADKTNEDKLLEKLKVEELPENSFMKGFTMSIVQIPIMTLESKHKNHEIDFNLDMQRGIKWNNSQSSLYIHSLLLGLSPYQPPFLVNKRTNDEGIEIWEVLDGKQRGLSAILNYLDNKFALSGLYNAPYIYYRNNPVNLNGKRFSALPEGLQGILKTINIPVAFSDNATQKQKSLIFARANNYKSMSSFDRARANKEDMSDILHLASHELFKNMIRSRAYESLDYHRIIVQAWIVENEETPVIKNSHITNIMSTLEMTESEQARLWNEFDVVLEAYKILNSNGEEAISKTICNVTHFLSYIAFIEKFSNSEECAAWFKHFFSSMPEEYVELTKRHTNDTGGLKRRKEIVEQSIENFLETYEKGSSEQVTLDNNV